MFYLDIFDQKCRILFFFGLEFEKKYCNTRNQCPLICLAANLVQK